MEQDSVGSEGQQGSVPWVSWEPGGFLVEEDIIELSLRRMNRTFASR